MFLYERITNQSRLTPEMVRMLEEAYKRQMLLECAGIVVSEPDFEKPDLIRSDVVDQLIRYPEGLQPAIRSQVDDTRIKAMKDLRADLGDMIQMLDKRIG